MCRPGRPCHACDGQCPVCRGIVPIPTHEVRYMPPLPPTDEVRYTEAEIVVSVYGNWQGSTLSLTFSGVNGDDLAELNVEDAAAMEFNDVRSALGIQLGSILDKCVFVLADGTRIDESK